MRPLTERVTKEMLHGVAEIENACFSEPWSEKSLELLLSDGGVAFAVRHEEKVIAYGGMTYVLDEGSITNIAVLEDFRRCGYASSVLEDLISFAKEQDLSFIMLEVRESNVSAISLYHKHGFIQVGSRKNFYKKPTENAIIMKLTLQN